MSLITFEVWNDWHAGENFVWAESQPFRALERIAVAQAIREAICETSEKCVAAALIFNQKQQAIRNVFYVTR